MEQGGDIFSYVAQLLQEIAAINATTADEVEKFRVTYLGSKGKVKSLMGSIKEVPNERKREFGQVANSVKQAAEDKWTALKEALASTATTSAEKLEDLTRPAVMVPLGGRHPLSLMRNEITRIFERIGFIVAEGPKLKTIGITLPPSIRPMTILRAICRTRFTYKPTRPSCCAAKPAPFKYG